MTDTWYYIASTGNQSARLASMLLSWGVVLDSEKQEADTQVEPTTNALVSSLDARVVPTQYSFDPPTPLSALPKLNLNQRTTAVAPNFSLQFLQESADKPVLLRAPTASAWLKEFLFESGYVFKVTRERGPSGFHATMEAVDFTSDNPDAMARLLRTMPSLFEQVWYTDADYGDESLFIEAGRVISTGTTEGGATEHIHLATTLTRLRGALRTRQVQRALANAGNGQFGVRSVYDPVVQEIDAASQQTGASFW